MNGRISADLCSAFADLAASMGTMIRTIRPALTLGLCLSLASGCLPELHKDKALTRFVYDDANVFTPAQRTTLDSLLHAYEQRTTNEIVLYTSADTTTTTDSIFRNAVQQLNDTLGVGKRFKNNGLVLAYTPKLHEVFTLSQQAMAKDTVQSMAIIDSVMLPLIGQERTYDAFLAGAHAYMDLADTLNARKLRMRAARNAH